MARDINNEARSLQSRIRQIVTNILYNDPRFLQTWQVRRAKVTAAASIVNGRPLMGVQIVGESAWVNLPYSITVANAAVDDIVLVALIGGRLSNALVWDFADFGVPVPAIFSKTVTGNPISVNDAVYDYAKAFSVDMPLTQLGSGVPSESNIRKFVAGNTLDIILNGGSLPITLQTQTGVFAAGTLNVLTGALTVTRECITLYGTETFAAAGTGDSRYLFHNFASAGYAVASTESGAYVCSHIQNGTPTSSTTGQGARIYDSSGNARFAIRNGHISSVSGFKTWLSDQYSAGTPVQFQYELVTPQTYTISPEQIALVAGGNTVSVNIGGDNIGTITMTYDAQL